MLTAVLDTQIILKGASSGTSSITAGSTKNWATGDFTPLLSEPLLSDIENVLIRPEVFRKVPDERRSKPSRR